MRRRCLTEAIGAISDIISDVQPSFVSDELNLGSYFTFDPLKMQKGASWSEISSQNTKSLSRSLRS